MYTVTEILERINKSRRPRLAAFLRERDSEDARVDVNESAFPASPRADRGTLVLVMTTPNPYHEGVVDFYAVSDTIAAKGQSGQSEIFAHFYRRRDGILELLGAEQPAQPTYDPSASYLVSREKAGRPRHDLTDEDVASIRALHAEGWGINRLATRYHVSNRRIIALLNDINNNITF